MTQAELREVWSTRINDYRASGERVATWCERHQVTPRQLWYWMRKLSKRQILHTYEAVLPCKIIFLRTM